MKTSKTVAKLLFVVGALVYLVGLWGDAANLLI